MDGTQIRMVPVEWNKLPPNIVRATSLNFFKVWLDQVHYKEPRTIGL